MDISVTILQLIPKERGPGEGQKLRHVNISTLNKSHFRSAYCYLFLSFTLLKTYTGWLKKSKLLYCVNSLLF